MEKLVKTQLAYFNTNTTKAVSFRIEQLNKLYQLLVSNEALLEEAIYKDYGKSTFETFQTEFATVYEEIKIAIRDLEQWSAIKPVATDARNAPAKSYQIPEPLGVSLVIGPWNYPYQLSLAPAVAAIAAGCTVILKPSELTANCSAVMAKIINENFEEQYFHVVEGGIAETTALLDQKFDIIFFTGSVPVGKIVYQAAAKNLTPVVLELGGKSPVIIMPDSDLEVTVKRLVWAKYLNSGQTCIAPDYVYVHQSIEQEFLEKVAKEIEKSDYKLENGNFVKIINERNAERVSGLINPDKVYVGGNFNVAERFIEPTVLHGVNWEDKVMKDEIFGPIMAVLTFDDLDTVIKEIKDRPKPLALYVFTKDENIQKKVMGEISFGGGCINDAIMHISNGNLPFGGVGSSGLGNYHGEAGFRAFSHYKGILEKEFTQDSDIKYSPHTEEKLQKMKAAAK
ncbi:aldehyde dehydrogenase [Pedobacter cryoconitis]|uniref:Aldehyde dehydrogenase n=1 Tax=Pedobacter cryoconitis TaxID=188932 RepID=A0A127VB40_9SPHI|nr:aldehyde dehydrogenase family protein [Pedobacter cryoconitis]AMP98576.1 aldehyde dehydrogenase [Pedobacter cryoconitis]